MRAPRGKLFPGKGCEHMSDGELLDAREAMATLGINEAELQTLVARGDLRAFRSAGTMKFRRDDVVGIKSEKKTEPTIIMPAPAQKTRPASGILPTVTSKTSPKSSSRNLPTIKPSSTPVARAQTTTGSTAGACSRQAEGSISADHIILEDLDLAPSEVDPAANTQQVTAQTSAVTGNATIVDEGLESGNVTIVENVDEGVATASAIGARGSTSHGIGAAASGVFEARCGRPGHCARDEPCARAAVSASSAGSASRRAQSAAATARRAHPISTVILILTTGISLLTASILGVQMVKGNYDPETHQRVIPPFLSEGSALPVYTWTYDKLPGAPEDKEGEYHRPSTEFPH